VIMESIRMHQRPEEATRSANNGCCWIAEAIVNRMSYTARSRHGAPHEMARVLLAAGIPDAPMQVYTRGLRGETTYRSFHAMADHTFRENAQTPVKRARWVAHPDGPQQYQAAPKQGVIAPSGTLVALEAFGDAGGPIVSAG
jgi:hypothetical protein